MKIAIDLLAQVPGRTGATALWRKMLALWPAIDQEIEYHVFVTDAHREHYQSANDEKWPNLHFVTARYSADSVASRIYYQEMVVPRYCDQRQIDVHLTANPVPVFRRMRAKEIWMIWSLQYYLVPAQANLLKSAYWQMGGFIKAKRASLIVANSEECSRVLQRVARVPQAKIAVVYEALDHDIFYPAPPQRDLGGFGVRAPYILNVSDNRPYKRQLDLIQAFASLVRNNVIAQHSLVIIGADYSGYRDMLRQAAESLGVGSKVMFISHLPIDLLPDFYRAADLFVYPSVLETFGIPPLEAMACGVPVIVANQSAVIEVSGGGACVVDLRKPGDLEGAMERVLRDPTQRSKYVEMGFEWAKRYHWGEHANQLVRLFYRAAA